MTKLNEHSYHLIVILKSKAKGLGKPVLSVFQFCCGETVISIRRRKANRLGSIKQRRVENILDGNTRSQSDEFTKIVQHK